MTGRKLCDKSTEDEEALFFLKLRQKFLLPFTEMKIQTQAMEDPGNLPEGPSAGAHSIT